MKIIKSEYNIFYDVDDTLVFHVDPTNPIPGRKVQVYDAVKKKFLTMIENQAMVRLLQEEKHRGAHVVVWSRGGHEWAANVVKALDLVGCVDQVMTKPMAYMDDLDISDWLKYRVYLPPTKVYKK
jgi:predicted phosphatase